MGANTQDSETATGQAKEAKSCDKRLGEDILTEFAFQQAKFKAGQLVKRPEFADCDVEDIEQELLMYLIQKAGSYDPSRSKLNTFISRVLTSGVRELVRSKKRHKRHPIEDDVQIQSFEQTVDTVDGTFANLGDEISAEDVVRRTVGRTSDPFDEIDERDAVEVAMSHLTPELQQIAASLGRDSIAETMRKFRLSRRQFEKAKTEIRQTFERFDATLSIE